MAVVFHQGLTPPTRPRVSVCIANYNGETLLPDCLDSVLAQDTDAAVEIIVHDDASPDGSLALLRERYPNVHVLASGENVGFCISNNRMVSNAVGEFVLLLNNDATLAPDAIRTLLAEAGRSASPAILTLPQYDWETDALVDRGCLLDPFHVPVPNLDPRRDEVAYVIGACLWIPRAAWNALGGFPNWFGSIAEDMSLCCAARLRGMPVRCTGASAYRHRQGASFGGNRVGGNRLQTRYRRRYLSERNRLAVLAACMPTAIVWPWFALHVMAVLVEGLVLSLATHSLRPWRKIYWVALRDAWQHRQQIRTMRTALQSDRPTGLRTYLSVFTLAPRKLTLLLRHGLPRIGG